MYHYTTDTPIKLHLTHDRVKPLNVNEHKVNRNAPVPTMDDLDLFGIGMGHLPNSNPRVEHDALELANEMLEMQRALARYGYDSAGPSIGMDAAPQMVTQPNIGNLIQFFQFFYPQVIRVITQARKIDQIAGRTVAGTWYDEQIVWQLQEFIGQPQPYNDQNNIPLADFNPAWMNRAIVRLELGLNVGELESGRNARMRINSFESKRTAIAEGFAIADNDIGFSGYYSGRGNSTTYGLLNEPQMPGYVTLPNGAAGTSTWPTKTPEEIMRDIVFMAQSLMDRSLTNFDPQNDSSVLVVASSVYQYLQMPNPVVLTSPADLIAKTYPNMRIVPVPQLNAANGGANVAYLIADSVAGQPVLFHMVQEQFKLLGIERRAKAIIEDYSMATAGITVTSPLGVVRFTGL